MRDVIHTFLMALAGSLAVALAGLAALRALHRRSVTVHIVVILLITVLSVLTGVTGASMRMFISDHDLHVLLIVVGTAATVSLAVGLLAGRRLARASMWAAEAREQERAAEARRRELVAWVSHDLRTPLAGLRAMAEALDDGVVADPETVADYHRRISAETDRMATLVDDLFELSRINAGALRLSLSDVPLGDVVSDAIASAAPLAAADHINIVAEPSTGWPVVRGSVPELSRVVNNLIRNAIRYTPPDGTVTVTGGQDVDGSGWLAVTDTCGGIPEADLPRVFDVAFRGAPARTPEKSAGGGLGLAIVRGLVEAHHGSVAADNVGAGCRFVVKLPAAVA
ncbi:MULTISPECIES: sensor histidine kinase [Dactylosporangium]|uniref:histidine kinase n=2 Tax=Dactylosporangium TaxID=35753 RepID=A0A9W6NKX8_9ACTN|nr:MULTISPECIES: HAMP domain-containing sensor histidine kinase [Dactylosporangium]UAB95711.1 HAMP domain-containing histidine kinase [Dactylosporangium vinaceum]UWZ44068.1 HAMP domain-containing histidine kinase [Dactylosporangium matsuzakiense]GLL00764.1 two-component sensor histidine kinase [Dactylosporangium matsuzakiense]